MAITFKKVCVHQGLHEWHIFADGERVGEMDKERAKKWHWSLRRLVQDRQAPWVWDAQITIPGAGRVRVEIPDGSTAWEARRLIKATLF